MLTLFWQFRQLFGCFCTYCPGRMRNIQIKVRRFLALWTVTLYIFLYHWYLAGPTKIAGCRVRWIFPLVEVFCQKLKHFLWFHYYHWRWRSWRTFPSCFTSYSHNLGRAFSCRTFNVHSGLGISNKIKYILQCDACIREGTPWQLHSVAKLKEESWIVSAKRVRYPKKTKWQRLCKASGQAYLYNHATSA